MCVPTCYHLLLASWFHLYAWTHERKWSFWYKQQLCTYSLIHKRIYTRKPSTLLTDVHPAKKNWCFLVWSNTRNLLLSYSLSNRRQNTHAHTGPNFHTPLFFSPFFFWRPHPLFLFFFAQENLHCTDTQFVWFSRNTVALAMLKQKHIETAPSHPFKELNLLVYVLDVSSFDCQGLMTRPVTMWQNKALHNQSPAHILWKGKGHWFYLELAPALIYCKYITQHGTITHCQMCFSDVRDCEQDAGFSG